MTLVVTPELEILLRLGLAVLCGLVVGMNRAHHGNTLRPNRLRVHVLVGMSACLLVLASGSDAQARSRAIQGVASGVGFLGAGEILVASRPKQTLPEVHGLTSAASIWFTAALGVTVATSTPLMAGAALLLALITLTDRDHPGEAPGIKPSGTGTRTETETETGTETRTETRTGTRTGTGTGTGTERLPENFSNHNNPKSNNFVNNIPTNGDLVDKNCPSDGADYIGGQKIIIDNTPADSQAENSGGRG
jgi:putative Mg2+ transporter-C (MgtC) family protein